VEVKDVQSLYNRTFGSLNKSEESYLAFVELLYKFNLIDDSLYFDLKQRATTSSFDIVGESFLTKPIQTIPLFEAFSELFDEEEKALLGEIYDNLETANHIVIKLTDDKFQNQQYDKCYDDKGLVIWKNIETDDIIDRDKAAELVNDLLNDFGNTMVMRDDYLNVIRGVEGEKYFDEYGMYKKLRTFFKDIVGGEPEDKKSWEDYLNYVKDAGIITKQQVSKLSKLFIDGKEYN